MFSPKWFLGLMMPGWKGMRLPSSMVFGDLSQLCTIMVPPTHYCKFIIINIKKFLGSTTQRQQGAGRAPGMEMEENEPFPLVKHRLGTLTS